jgi:hypothetical protein
MNVSSVTTFGSAAIASPPANTTITSNPRPDDRPEAPSPAPQIFEAAKETGTGQLVDKKV